MELLPEPLNNLILFIGRILFFTSADRTSFKVGHSASSLYSRGGGGGIGRVGEGSRGGGINSKGVDSKGVDSKVNSGC